MREPVWNHIVSQHGPLYQRTTTSILYACNSYLKEMCGFNRRTDLMNWQCVYCKYTTSYYLLEKNNEVCYLCVNTFETPYIHILQLPLSRYLLWVLLQFSWTCQNCMIYIYHFSQRAISCQLSILENFSNISCFILFFCFKYFILFYMFYLIYIRY